MGSKPDAANNLPDAGHAPQIGSDLYERQQGERTAGPAPRWTGTSRQPSPARPIHSPKWDAIELN
jgi:hypothetical protein